MMNFPILLFSPLAAAGNASSSVGLLYWFYIEGLAFAVAMIYIYRILRKGGWRFYDSLAKWVDGAVIDDFYHKYLPGAVETSYRKLFHKFETPVVDEGYNRKLVDGVLGIGRVLRRFQTGKINQYLIAFVLGLIFFIAVLFGMLFL